MIRFALAATLVMLAAAPAVAQTTPAQAPVQKSTAPNTPLTPGASPTPESEAWLRQRSESYSVGRATQQDPAEVATTVQLNTDVAARNDAAERNETEGTAAWEAEDARWRAETARLETQRAQWEADSAAAEAARARYERERAAWESEMAACERSGRVCIAVAPPY